MQSAIYSESRHRNQCMYAQSNNALTIRISSIKRLNPVQYSGKSSRSVVSPIKTIRNANVWILKAKCKCTVQQLINVVHCPTNEETGYTYKDHASCLNTLTTTLLVGGDYINSNIHCGI